MVGLVVVVEDLGVVVGCVRAFEGCLSWLGGFASKLLGHLVVGRLFGCIRRGLVGLGLVAVARRISSVVGLAVGGVVLRLGVSVRAFNGIMPMLGVGIDLTGAVCVAGAVASLAGVCGLVRVGGRRVGCRLSTMWLLVAAQGVPGRSVLLGAGGRVGGSVSTSSCPGGVTVAGGGISARNAVRITGGHARIGTVRTLRRGRRTTVGTSISTNMTAALARGGTSSVRTTRGVAYAATDISGIGDTVRAMSSAPCVRSEISGTAEAVRSVADTARIAATERAGALVGSLSSHAGLATTNARTDKLTGTARLTISVGQAVIQVGRVLPVLSAETISADTIEIVPVRRETIGIPRIVGLARRLAVSCSGRIRPDLVRSHRTIMANTVRIIRLVRRLPARSSTMRATRGSAGSRSASRGSAMRTCAGRGCTGGSRRTGSRSASRGSAMRTCAGRGCTGGSRRTGGGNASRGSAMRATRGSAGGSRRTGGGSASRGSAMRARTG